MLCPQAVVHVCDAGPDQPRGDRHAGQESPVHTERDGEDFHTGGSRGTGPSDGSDD